MYNDADLTMPNSSNISKPGSENVTTCDLKPRGNPRYDELDFVKGSFDVGDRVEAKFRGKSKSYYKGSVTTVHLGGTYDIDYDDGDRDRQLSADFIRLLPSVGSETLPEEIIIEKQEDSACPIECSAHPPKEVDVQTAISNQTFDVGDRVEARTIKGKRSSVTYDVEYDDSDVDHSLPSEAIGPIPNISAAIALYSHRNELETNLKVRKSSHYGPLSDATNRTVSTMMATKIKSTSVPSSVVSVGSPNASNRLDCDGTAKSREESFKAGDKVEALYRGKGKIWYKGIVSSRLPNGCYNVRYDAGDHDLRLPPKAVRAINRGAPNVLSVQNAAVAKGSKKIPTATVLRTSDDIETYTTSEDFAAESLQFERQTTRDEEVHEPSPKNGDNDLTAMNTCIVLHCNDFDSSFDLPDHKPIVEQSEVDSNNTKEEALTSTAAAVEISIEDISNETEVATDTNIMCHGKGNKLFRGVISKVKVINLYEISYPDGTKDVNIPIEALRLGEGVSHDDVKIGTCVDVLSWQDRWH